MKSTVFRPLMTMASAIFICTMGIATTLSASFPEHAQRELDPFLQRLHLDACYHVWGYSDNGDVVQLHDASKWSVTPNKRSIVLQWKKSNKIFIKPAYSCYLPRKFMSYDYVLYNLTRNEFAEVSLIPSETCPLPMGAATFRVAEIEPHQHLIQLSDNTWWQIDPKDPHFSSWRRGHRILVGVNNKWRTAPYPQILINVDVNQQPFSEAIFYHFQ